MVCVIFYEAVTPVQGIFIYPSFFILKMIPTSNAVDFPFKILHDVS